MSRWPCKGYFKGTSTNSHPPECLFYKTKSGCRFWEKCSYAHRQVDEQPSKRSKKNDDKSAVAMLKKNDLHESVWQPVVNRDKSHERPGDPMSSVILVMSWNKDLLDDDHRTHDNWVVSFTRWSRRSPSNGRVQTCGNQSNVWNSRKRLHVTLKFETKILRSDIFSQVNLMSVAPTLQNLRIGLRRRQSGKSKVPAKQRGGWPKVF